MNLGKLLAAGKSIVNGKGAVEYRENKQVFLPKFASPKNPFTPKKAAETVSAPARNETAPSPPVSLAQKDFSAK